MSLTKIINILFFICLIISCNQKGEQITKNQLYGYWVSEKYLAEDKDTFQFIMNVSENELIFQGFGSAISRYSLTKNLLIVKTPEYLFCENAYTPTYNLNYKIIRVTEDSLIIQPLKYSGIIYNELFFKNKKIIKFYRNPQHDFSVKKIFFSSSGCYGSCPSHYLEINADGSGIYLGRNPSCPKGEFKIILSREQIKNVTNLINQVELKSLKDYYEANWTDDQRCSILIETTDGNFKTSVYGTHKEPKELRMLFNYLLELPRKLKLIETQLDELEILHQEIIKGINPSPPVELPPMHKFLPPKN